MLFVAIRNMELIQDHIHEKPRSELVVALSQSDLLLGDEFHNQLNIIPK